MGDGHHGWLPPAQDLDDPDVLMRAIELALDLIEDAPATPIARSALFAMTLRWLTVVDLIVSPHRLPGLSRGPACKYVALSQRGRTPRGPRESLSRHCCRPQLAAPRRAGARLPSR
ncbi:hypothetical protein Mame01_65440 [Microbispora amethystogenes]|nr:hypothetical protein Mame01_65440 [Microbispora amethystogenes]